MIESTVRRTHQELELDLLPWADPYILQLFLESEPLVHPGSCESAAGVPRSTGDHRIPAVVAAPLNSASGAISLTRRRSTPRRRRTESECLLARC